MRNYYQDLGLEPDVTSGCYTCSESDIIKAYRGLAKKWHPDRNLNNPAVGLKFQIIANAYEFSTQRQLKKLSNEMQFISIIAHLYFRTF